MVGRVVLLLHPCCWCCWFWYSSCSAAAATDAQPATTRAYVQHPVPGPAAVSTISTKVQHFKFPTVHAALKQFSVLDYGAVGDGLHDDTAAIQAALNAAGAATFGHQQAIKHGGDSSLIHPTLVFPAGIYLISETLYPEGHQHHRNSSRVHPAQLLGESAEIKQSNASADILYAAHLWRWRIAGIHFIGGRNHIHIGNNDTDESFFTVVDCLFANASSASIRTIGPGWWSDDAPDPYFRGSASTQVTVKNSQFYANRQVAVNWCDQMVFEDIWVEGAPGPGFALFENHDKLFLSRMLGVPESGMLPGSDQRWIDNHNHGATGGQVVARDCRFGGEGGGFTIVVNYASFLCAPAHRSKWLHHLPASYYKDCQPPPSSGRLPSSTYGSVAGVIVLDSCMIASDGDHSVAPDRLASVYLEELPSQLIIRNSWGFAFRPQFVAAQDSSDVAVVRVSPSIDLDGEQLDYAAAHPGLLRFDIGEENSFIPDGGDNVTGSGLPQQLLPYAAGRVMADAPPTRGVWRKNQIVWARVLGPNITISSSGEFRDGPAGWQCTQPGKPGLWRPIGNASSFGSDRSSAGVDIVQSLERLALLHQEGQLTEMEYSAAKAVVIKLEADQTRAKFDDDAVLAHDHQAVATAPQCRKYSRTQMYGRGGVLRYAPTDSWEDYCALCGQTLQCRAWETRLGGKHAKPPGSNCWLHSDDALDVQIGNWTSKTNHISGVVYQPAPPPPTSPAPRRACLALSPPTPLLEQRDMGTVLARGTLKSDDKDVGAATLSIIDFGGVPIHKSQGKVVRLNNQRAIQKAMLACAAASGCSLTFPRRDTEMEHEPWPYGQGPAIVTTYLTSAFNVTSNLKLVIPEGVQLRGTESFAENCGGTNRSSCNDWDSPSWPVLPNWVYPSALQDPGQAPAKQAWLRGYNLTNLTFTGGGILHGGGGWWWCVRMLAAGQQAGPHAPKWCPRMVADGQIPAFEIAAPPMIMLIGSSNILWENLLITHSPMFCLTHQYSNNIEIRNITIYNPNNDTIEGPNTDGCDLFSCSNAHIHNVTVDVGDDMFAMDSGVDAAGRRNSIPTADIVIENSVVRNGHGLTLGSGASGGLRNITYRNIFLDGYGGPQACAKRRRGAIGGIHFKTGRGRGGHWEDITWENIYGSHATAALTFFENHGSGYNQALGPTNKSATPTISNLLVQNVALTEVAGPSQIFSLFEAPIQNFTIRNVSWSRKNSLSQASFGIGSGSDPAPLPCSSVADYCCGGWKGKKIVNGLFATGSAIAMAPPWPKDCSFASDAPHSPSHSINTFLDIKH